MRGLRVPFVGLVLVISLVPGVVPAASAGSALTVSVRHGPARFLPGMFAGRLVITVSNRGGAAAAGPVTVTSAVPAGLAVVDAAGAGWDCAGTAIVSCTRKDRLAARSSYPPVTVVVNVAGTVPPSVTTTAAITGGATATDTIALRDACPYGWQPGAPVAFAPPFRPGRPGGISSGVPNPERPDGCTLLDEIWNAEPFAGHQSFLTTVRRATRAFGQAGLLTREQRRAVEAAATRSEVGTPADRQLDNSCTDRIALKFDDGVSARRPQLLRLLRDKQVHATFFDNGVRVRANPRLNAFQAYEGHIQLNHTDLHVHMDELPDAANIAEIRSTEVALADAGAPLTFKGIRPPFGGSNPAVRRLLLELGYTQFRNEFQIGADDWLPERTATAISDDIVRQLRPGVIVALHDGPIDTTSGTATVAATGQIIDRARALGYCFGVPDETGHVVADRYVASSRPVPSIAAPVPYHLPLAFGEPADLPHPYVRIPSPIRIAAAHRPAAFVRGQTGNTLTLTVHNTGRRPTDGAAVTVAGQVPAGLTVTAVRGDGWSCTGTAAPVCVRSDVLAPHASYPPIVMTVNVSATAPSEVVHSATLTGHGETWTHETTDHIPVS